MLNAKKNLRTGQPLWRALAFPHIPAQTLNSDKKTDIVVIGAGITGAMAAQELSDAGFKVIMLDRRGPLKGATSATTALLQYEIDQPLIKLQKQIGQERAMRAWRRSKLGLESLAAKIKSLNIDCDFGRTSSLYLAGNVLDAKGLKEEWNARNEIGIRTDYCTRAQLREHYHIKRSAALLSFDNLSVNPLKMAAGFLQSAMQEGTRIFAPVTVDHVDAGADKTLVRTNTGHTVSARYLVYATGYEVPNVIRSKAHSLHSTYAIATKRQPDKLWPGKCFIWESSDPYLYIRTTPDGRVICGGEDEEFENEEKRDALIKEKTAVLEKKLGALFPRLSHKAEFAWSGSFGASNTGLPTIGEIPGMKRCFIIMAFGGNGITYSRIAAEIITSHLTGREDPDADLFTPKK